MSRPESHDSGLEGQVWGAFVHDDSHLEAQHSGAQTPQPDEDLLTHPVEAEAITCFPWEGYYQDAPPRPSPTLEAFLFNLMFGE